MEVRGTRFEKRKTKQHTHSHTRLKRKQSNGARCMLWCRGRWGQKTTRKSHLWEARSEQSAAGQQNWCSTVSFLRVERREKVS